MEHNPDGRIRSRSNITSDDRKVLASLDRFTQDSELSPQYSNPGLRSTIAWFAQIRRRQEPPNDAYFRIMVHNIRNSPTGFT